MCIILPIWQPKKTKLKYKLCQKALGCLMKYINIFNFVKSLEDFEKIKSILLNNHQIILFNYFSKQKISLSNNNSNISKNSVKISEESSHIQNEVFIRDIKNYYNDLNHQHNWSLIDKKLFSDLDEEFKEYFFS